MGPWSQDPEVPGSIPGGRLIDRKPPFFSVDGYTCRAFDPQTPINYTKEFFGDYEVIGTEIALYEPMREVTLDPNYRFKGYVDAVIKTKDGKYHLIDWKTCSWGWDFKKRSDKILSYQLVFYKHFFAKKYICLSPIGALINEDATSLPSL